MISIYLYILHIHGMNIYVYIYVLYIEIGNVHPFQYSCLRNPMDREPGRLQSSGLQRVRHNRMTDHTHTHSSYVYIYILHIYLSWIFIFYLSLYILHHKANIQKPQFFQPMLLMTMGTKQNIKCCFPDLSLCSMVFSSSHV